MLSSSRKCHRVVTIYCSKLITHAIDRARRHLVVPEAFGHSTTKAAEDLQAFAFQVLEPFGCVIHVAWLCTNYECNIMRSSISQTLPICSVTVLAHIVDEMYPEIHTLLYTLL